MATYQFTNNAEAVLTAAMTTTQTTLSISSLAAGQFPSLSVAGSVFYVTVTQAAGGLREIMQVTAVAGGDFTVVRAQDGTPGRAFAIGDSVSHRLVAVELNDFVTSATFNALQTQVNNLQLQVNAFPAQINAAKVNAQLPVGATIVNNSSSTAGMSYGTWAIVFTGKTLVGYDSASGIWTNTIGGTFGSLTQALAANNIPSHTHPFLTSTLNTDGGSAQRSATGNLQNCTYANGANRSLWAGTGDVQNPNVVLASSGGTTPVNIVQPSVVVVFWQRTA